MQGSPLVGQNNMQAFAEHMNSMSAELIREIEITDSDSLQALGELLINAAQQGQRSQQLMIGRG